MSLTTSSSFSSLRSARRRDPKLQINFIPRTRDYGRPTPFKRTNYLAVLKHKPTPPQTSNEEVGTKSWVVLFPVWIRVGVIWCIGTGLGSTAENEEEPTESETSSGQKTRKFKQKEEVWGALDWESEEVKLIELGLF
jgi:hypothetical protein